MPFTWSEAQQRYRDTGTGRFVSSSAVRADIDRMLDDVAHRTGDLTRLLQDGRMGLRDWQTMMAQEIKDVHTANAVLARGGWENMTERDWGRVGHIIRDEYGHLNRWATDLQTGRAPLDGRALVRAEQYTQAGRGTYEEVKRYAARDVGLLWEYNVLEPTAAHCDGCLDADAMGVRPVGEIPAIGSRDCLTRCRCELIQTADPPGSIEDAPADEEPIDHALPDATRELVDVERALQERGVDIRYGSRGADGEIVDLPKAEDAVRALRGFDGALNAYEKHGIRAGMEYDYDTLDRKAIFGQKLQIVNDTESTWSLATAVHDGVRFNTAVIEQVEDSFRAALASYRDGTVPMFASTSHEDVIIHELGHTIHHGATKVEFRAWQKLIDDTPPHRDTLPSIYATENSAEAFAESIVRLVGDHPGFEGPLADKALSMLASFAERAK
jgi:hypothetical protein